MVEIKENFTFSQFKRALRTHLHEANAIAIAPIGPMYFNGSIYIKHRFGFTDPDDWYKKVFQHHSVCVNITTFTVILRQIQIMVLYPFCITIGTVLNFDKIRKSSCVNVRGIPTAAYQVLHMLPPLDLAGGRGRYLGYAPVRPGQGRGRYLGRGVKTLGYPAPPHWGWPWG